MNYRQTIEYLYEQLPVFHRIGLPAYKPDIGNIVALSEILGWPHQNFRSVHIAGTNGKGSVSHLLASILQSAGYKTGLHTSPHLKDYRERFRINGRMIGKREVINFVKSHKSDFEKIKPSFFEMSVALAFHYFSNNNVDIAVIETGMGGRLDSTNILIPEVSVITNIGWDHTMFLGDTLTKIATEKAGIIKPGIPVVIGETHPETKEVFIAKAKEMNVPVNFADQEFTITKTDSDNNFGSYYKITRKADVLFHRLYCPMGGQYQMHNILTVLMAVELLRKRGFHITDTQTASGIANVVKQTGIKGRWQVLGRKPLTIADVGHNKDGIEKVLNQIREIPYTHLHFVFGMVNDKDIDAILLMLPKTATYYFCKANIPRGLDVEFLSTKAKMFGLDGNSYDSVSAAFTAARNNAAANDLVFVGGSSFVVAEVV